MRDCEPVAKRLPDTATAPAPTTWPRSCAATAPKPTIAQRGPTLIVNVEPSAQLYDGIYSGKGPTYEDHDLINVSGPLRVMRRRTVS